VIWDVGLGAGGNVLTVLRGVRDAPCRLRILSFDRTTEALAFALQHGKELGYIDPYAGAIEKLLTHHRGAHLDTATNGTDPLPNPLPAARGEGIGMPELVAVSRCARCAINRARLLTFG